jgi:hypothetical protein
MARSFASGDVIVGSNNQINFALGNAFSIHGWVRCQSSTGTAESLIGHLDPAINYRGWEIERTTAINPGAMAFYIIDTYSNKDFFYIGSVVIPHDGVTWAAIGVSYDGSGLLTGQNLYNNGVLDGSPSVGQNFGGSVTITNAIPLRFGKRNDGSEPFTGAMADFGIWNVALSAAEFSALGKYGARPYTVRAGSLVAYFPLDGLASPEPDLSGFVNNGTLTGTAKASTAPPLMMFTSRWPMTTPISTPSFQAAWAIGKNTVVEGVAT